MSTGVILETFSELTERIRCRQSSPSVRSLESPPSRSSPSFSTFCACDRASSHTSKGSCSLGSGWGGKKPVLVSILMSKSAGTGCTSCDTHLLGRRDCRMNNASSNIRKGDDRRLIGYMVSWEKELRWIPTHESVPFIQHIPLQVVQDHISEVT